MSRPLSLVLVNATLPLALLCATPAWALYKVVGPDGRVTYTDRAPVDRPAVAIKSNGSSTAVSTDNLPFELKQVAIRYPVVLYTSAQCAACDAGRQALQTRGIPFAEKTVQTPEDVKALQSQEKSERLPLLKVGSKQLLGYSPAEWTSYLDAAGYPAQSALPPGYRQAAATPLAPRVEASPAGRAASDTGVAPSPASPAVVPRPPAGNAPPGFKF